MRPGSTGVVQDAGVPARPSLSTRHSRHEPKASTVSVAQRLGTLIPASDAARMMDVPSGTVTSKPSMVKVTMTCKHDVKRITIDPSLLADDKDMLEDLVAAAFNAAVRKAEETSQEKMGKLSQGMPGLPVGMKFPC